MRKTGEVQRKSGGKATRMEFVYKLLVEGEGVSLEEARKNIDRVDAEIVRLLDERARIGREIGRIKASLGTPPHNPGREREVLRRLRELSDGSLPGESLERIYRVVMAEVLALQERPEAGCAGHDAAGKLDVSATVLENVRVAPGFYRMRLLAPELAGAFEPGQFFQLRIGEPGSGYFLRRPFAPAEVTGDGFSFFYAVVGEGTRGMSGMEVGREVRVLAPLGNGFTLLPAGSSAVVVGGGCGAPSLAYLARRLREGGVYVTVLLGARTSTAVLGADLFSRFADRLIVATDDGSEGCLGTAVDAYRVEKEGIRAGDMMYACGPLPMLRSVAGLAEELGVRCEVSLEERMACGFGACMGCVVPVLAEDGSVFRRVCHEGPVFDARTLAWNEIR